MPLAEHFGVDDLAKWLAMDARDVSKLVSRGKLPARRIGGEWRFHRSEITKWIESELHISSCAELLRFEGTPIAVQSHKKNPGGMICDSVLLPECVVYPLQGKTKASVLRELVSAAANSYRVWDSDAVLKALQDREDLATTALSAGVAFPHPGKRMSGEISECVMAMGVTQSGIPFGAPDGGLTHLFFLVLATDDASHLAILARLSRLTRSVENLVQRVRDCGGPHHTMEILREAESGFESENQG